MHLRSIGAVYLVVATLGVDVVGVRHQRPPHQALVDLSFFSTSGAAARLLHGRQASRLLVQLQTYVRQNANHSLHDHYWHGMDMDSYLLLVLEFGVAAGACCHRRLLFCCMGHDGEEEERQQQHGGASVPSSRWRHGWLVAVAAGNSLFAGCFVGFPW